MSTFFTMAFETNDHTEKSSFFLGAKRKTKSFRSIVIQGYARHSECLPQPSKASISYQWTVSPAVELDANSKSTPRLFVRRRTLKAGSTYKFKLTASIVGNPGSYSSHTVEVTVEVSRLVARLSGGIKRYVGK